MSATGENGYRLLTVCCCEGGDAKGYASVGFVVEGVDIDPKFAKRFPFKFQAADAVGFIREHGHEYDAIHASPPCQHASAGTRAQDRSRYPRLIEPIREALIASGKPYVIENVKGSALIDPLVLCGTMFGLRAIDDDGTPLELWRHRHFESNVPLTAPSVCKHHEYSEQVAGSYGGARRDKDEARNVRHGGYVPSFKVQQQLLDIDWMTQHGMYQSVPPVYAAWVGSQIKAALNARRESSAARCSALERKGLVVCSEPDYSRLGMNGWTLAESQSGGRP